MLTILNYHFQSFFRIFGTQVQNFDDKFEISRSKNQFWKFLNFIWWFYAHVMASLYYEIYCHSQSNELFSISVMSSAPKKQNMIKISFNIWLIFWYVFSWKFLKIWRLRNSWNYENVHCTLELSLFWYFHKQFKPVGNLKISKIERMTCYPNQHESATFHRKNCSNKWATVMLVTEVCCWR